MGMKKEDGVLVRSKEELKGIWKVHFERLMDTGHSWEGNCASMGRKWWTVQGLIERKEVKEATARLKYGKAADVYGITSEMLKYVRDAVVK